MRLEWKLISDCTGVTSNVAPSARCAGLLAPLDENSLYVFGGSVGTLERNDMWKYELCNLALLQHLTM